MLALAAGRDLLCIGPDKPTPRSCARSQAPIVAAVADGRLPEAGSPRPPRGSRALRRAARPRRRREPLDARRRRPARRAGRARASRATLPDLAGAVRRQRRDRGQHRRRRRCRGACPADRRRPGAADALPTGRRTDVPAGRAGPRRAPPARTCWRCSTRWPRRHDRPSSSSGAGPARTTSGLPTDLHARLVSRPGVAAVTELLREAGWDR